MPLHLVHRQGRDPTCPFCNSVIHLEVKYRLPWTVLSPEVRLCLCGTCCMSQISHIADSAVCLNGKLLI